MVLHHECFHIRKSADRSLFAAPRSLSQLVTSFFGSWCQVIHLMLLFAWTSFWISSAVLFELLEFLWTLFGFLFAVKRFDPFYKFSFRPDKTFVLFLGNCSSLPKFFGKTYSNLLFIKMCPLLSVRFYSFYFFIRFSMNIFFSVRFLALFYAKLLIGPRHCRVVGSSGLEPPTSRLSGARSNHLSYEPIKLLSMYLVSLAFCFSAFRG